MQEVEAGIMHAENTAIIKKAWPVYYEEIISLFQQCLEKSDHPLVFKNAILCVLPKLEKCY